MEFKQGPPWVQMELLSCGTDGAFKVKGSLLRAAYTSLDSQSLTAAGKAHHAVNRQSGESYLYLVAFLFSPSVQPNNKAKN